LFEKYIYYSNTCAAITAQVVKIGKWIDKNGFKSDILTVVRSLKRKHKFYHVRVFNRSNRPNIQVLKEYTETDRPFNPKILATTSGAANAGLDDPEVFGVTRIDFPPSIMDIKQEKGRAGRCPGATPDCNWYVLCFSLESFVVLLKQMWDSPNQESTYLTQTQREIDTAFLPHYGLYAYQSARMDTNDVAFQQTFWPSSSRRCLISHVIGWSAGYQSGNYRK
jgi:hypothetical protein